MKIQNFLTLLLAIFTMMGCGGGGVFAKPDNRVYTRSVLFRPGANAITIKVNPQHDPVDVSLHTARIYNAAGQYISVSFGDSSLHTERGEVSTSVSFNIPAGFVPDHANFEIEVRCDGKYDQRLWIYSYRDDQTVSSSDRSPEMGVPFVLITQGSIQ